MPVLSQSTVVRSSLAPFYPSTRDTRVFGRVCVRVGSALVRSCALGGYRLANASTFVKMIVTTSGLDAYFRIYWFNPEGPICTGASVAYLANQHSKHRDHVANYGTRDTISTTMRLFICSAARLWCNE